MENDEKLTTWLRNMWVAPHSIQDGPPRAYFETTDGERHVYQTLTSSGVKEEGAAFKLTFKTADEARAAYKTEFWSWLVASPGKALWVRAWPTVERMYETHGDWVVFSRLAVASEVQRLADCTDGAHIFDFTSLKCRNCDEPYRVVSEDYRVNSALGDAQGIPRTNPVIFGYDPARGDDVAVVVGRAISGTEFQFSKLQNPNNWDISSPEAKAELDRMDLNAPVSQGALDVLSAVELLARQAHWDAKQAKTDAQHGLTMLALDVAPQQDAAKASPAIDRAFKVTRG